MLSHLPIPRLPNRHAGRQPGRTARACDYCRMRKWKCDGNRPICGQCASTNQVSCVYSEPKRDRDQKELERVTQKADPYERLLREVSREVELPVARKIWKALRQTSQRIISQQDATISSNASSASSIDSLDDLDVLDEDLNRSKQSRATGYIGKSSEVAWMRGLEMAAGGPSRNAKVFSRRSSSPPESATTTSFNYHIEPAEYPGSEVNNPYDLPPKALAHWLLGLFFDSVQPSLPIIRQDLFTGQFNLLYSERPRNPGRKWLAVLNLIFAISNRLCQISGQDVQDKGHQFFSRAQTLNISESLVEDHEDLQQVQVEALAAFYLLASSHVNRAWKMIGTAARSSISLGLHLRASHNKLNAQALEARHKLRWSIFILENLLSVMTGRPSGLGNSFSSAAPPLASEDMGPFTNNASNARLDRPSENPPMQWTMNQQYKRLKAQLALTKTMPATDKLYFFCLADLIVISHTASTRVYSTDAVKRGFDEIESRIDLYNTTMVDWRTGLPDSLSFEVIDAGPNLTVTDSYRLSLAMHYHSSRILLNRPCLTRKKKDGKSADTNHLSRQRKDIEETCLHSALAILEIFPDEPGSKWLCSIPWWNVLHFLVQAITILLIQISFGGSFQVQKVQNSTSESSSEQLLKRPDVGDHEVVRIAAKKALAWLCHLGKTDDSARRAYEKSGSCLRRIESISYHQDDLTAVTDASQAPNLDVPTDQAYQQGRSRLNVSYSQFADSKGFGYDRNNGGPAVAPEDTEGFSPIEPSVGTLRADIDISDCVPDPENGNLEDLLQFLG
ncbi:unnamed protein product [Penicillium olsonii]|nr:unnamed protein product [Penicillium olsonii]CAG8183065.1 unnamed protein product [Penicillium olsonii]